ncbi:MAG: GDP-mannose 4,6-dehydratase [Bacteroidota bacterium]|nr:GDP-mannose 4,6-dehydratase [Bacteroidota bacterium]
MAILVTGCAGFIGSHLTEKLLLSGEQVVGIDMLTPYYPVERKRKNLEILRKHQSFRFVEGNLNQMDIASLLNNITVIYHLAGQPGVRLSWGKDFDEYVDHNIRATQRLLEAVKNISLQKLVYASSSSVYGNVDRDILTETDVPTPFSPYGVTKLAGEHLVNSYRANFGVPVTSLRFFTVFGPRQRPDMAFQRVVEALINGNEFVVYGDGTQVRDFTYVEDIVNGCIAAANRGRAGEVYNLGGTNLASLNDALNLLQEIAGKKLNIKYIEKQSGDVSKTRANISKAQSDLQYQPHISLAEGLKRQFLYQSSLTK